MTQQFTGEVKQQFTGDEDQARGCDGRPQILLEPKSAPKQVTSAGDECSKTIHIRGQYDVTLGPDILRSFSQKEMFFSSEKEISFSMSFEDAKEISFKEEKEISFFFLRSFGNEKEITTSSK